MYGISTRYMTSDWTSQFQNLKITSPNIFEVRIRLHGSPQCCARGRQSWRLQWFSGRTVASLNVYYGKSAVFVLILSWDASKKFTRIVTGDRGRSHESLHCVRVYRTRSTTDLNQKLAKSMPRRCWLGAFTRWPNWWTVLLFVFRGTPLNICAGMAGGMWLLLENHQYTVRLQKLQQIP